MKLKFPLIAAFVAVLSLTACGGGGSGSGSTSSSAVASPATFSFTDTTTGTGASATSGKNVTVKYTGWLYSTTAAGNKGTQFDSGQFSFVVGTGAVIQGFDQGVQGMKVGGKRTVLIPSSMGYGSAGTSGIPGNSGLVFDIELVAVQ
ncbi:MAG: FKBP-type peptidyl-prolyl cis-trans isomerase [Telluria sp.]